MAKTPQPRWYVDADTIGLGHVLARARRDVTYCGDSGERHRKNWTVPPCVIQDTATPDEVWIPLVTQAGLAIITRDKHIETRSWEKAQVIAAKARMFAITSQETLDIWGLTEVTISRWRDIEAAAEQPGPFIYAVTRSGIRKINLSP
jgi:hypothetical protein